MASDEGSALTPEIRKSTPSELKTRVVSALVMVILALLAAYWGGWPFALFWLAAGIAMMVEWTDMVRSEPRRPVQAVYGLGLLALTVLFLFHGSFMASAAVALITLVAGALLTQGSREKLWSAAAFVYAAIIVLVPPLVRAAPELGILGLIWMFAVVWAISPNIPSGAVAITQPVIFIMAWNRLSQKPSWASCWRAVRIRS